MCHLFKSFKNKKYLKLFDADGKEIPISQVVVPIIQVIESGRTVRPIGSGFIIHQYGGLITAKHCLVNEKTGLITPDLGVFQFIPEMNRPIFRRLEQITISENADVGAAVLEEKFANREKTIPYTTPVLPLALNAPTVGQEILQIGLPNSFVEAGDSPFAEFNYSYIHEKGHITQHFENGRDKVLMNFNCYEAKLKTESGASGGPVLLPDGSVIGLNCRSMDLGDGWLSYFTSTDEILKIEVPIGPNQVETIRNLINRGSMGIKHN